MLLKPAGKVPHGGGRRFRDDSLEYRRIKEWLEQGALPPSVKDKKVVRIETLPARVRLTPGEKQQLTVLAYYNDGSRADVTPWVKFDTTDDAVATVSSTGLAEMKGSGSAALTGWFSSKVTFTTISVPFTDPIDANVFAQADRRNFIDDAILHQLQALHIAPSPPSDDFTFVRRVYLDTVGVLPTKDEMVDFVFEPSPDKRARLIDRLLERPEYVDYWTYKWCDLLLVTQNKLRSDEAVWAFYRYIRKNVADNRGWNHFVNDILTAQGSNLENGAGNYFLMHKETRDLTETTSQAFLGMSITCARCHNHPLEKWTQDQYYSFANLFARVKLKNSDRVGETFVLSSDFGNVLHPLKNKPMPPTPLDGDPVDDQGGEDRRAHLAEWLTAPENPYFARAVVNRVWKNFMGRGLVEPEDDLRLTNPPVNEELFAALEKDFVDHGDDVKQLIRTILNSAAYQRSSESCMGNEKESKHFSRYYPRRLPAEVILDAFASATEVPTPFSGYPQGWRALQLPDSGVASTFLATFGRPERVITCACERQSTPTLPQSLHLSNGDTLNEKLRHPNNVIGHYLDQGMGLEEIIMDLYLRTDSRPPTEAEKKNLLALANVPEGWGSMEREAKREMLEDMLWAQLSSKEFLFNH